MTLWNTLSDEQASATWDQIAAHFNDCSPFQSYDWGEFRRALGWAPSRLVAVDDAEQVVAMIQVYVRKYALGIGLIWSEGGPTGDLSAFDKDFQQLLRDATGLSRCYVRFRSDRRRNIE